MLLILLITIFTYLGMIIYTRHRIGITLIGAGLLLICGGVTQYFDADKAFDEFPSEIVILIIVLTLFTSTFEQLGFINYIGYQFLRLTRKKRIRIMIFMSLLVYATSLFMNNLTVVLFFASIALYMIMEYDLPVIPLLVSIVIGSNIGGAPLPWADTPAVVLTLYSDFGLMDFLNKLFIPCLIYAIGLSFYTYIWYKRLGSSKRGSPFERKPEINWKRLSKFLCLFLVYIVGLSVGPFFDISIAYISLFFGGVLLCLRKKDEMMILNELPILDSLVFIITLFLIGSVLQQSGILFSASEYIIGLTDNNPYLITLSVILIAFLTSTLLSAGPAAATLLPICKTLDLLVPFKIIYAALALGILCGSSMLPWSATGGPILLSQTRSFLNKLERKQIMEQMPKKAEEIKKIFGLGVYLAFSVPFALGMLLVSSVYLMIYIAVTS